MNFKDCLIALGSLPGEVGVECSGLVTAIGAQVHDLSIGDHVSAIGARFANKIRLDQRTVGKIPQEWPSKVAASCFVVYMTAWYSLVYVARLAKDDTILIHAAAGGLGQAAVPIAHLIGAKVYATTSTTEKRALLTKELAVSEDCIFDCRSTSFNDDVMRATRNRGVDVVLNSLTEWRTLDDD